MLLLIGTSAFGQYRDRRLTGVRVERAASNTGRVRVVAVVDVLTSDQAAVDLSFKIRLYRGQGTTGALVGEEDVPVSRTAGNPCGTLNYYTQGCAGGMCPIGTVWGIPIPLAECTPVDNPDAGCGGYECLECTCIFGDLEGAVDEVKVTPGEVLTVAIQPLGPALPDAPGTPANDQMIITVGSRADQSGFGLAGPSLSGPSVRLPSPMTGQGNSTVSGIAMLDASQAPLTSWGDGPVEYWVDPLSPVILRHSGAANMPVALFMGTPKAGSISLGTLSIDIDPTESYWWIYGAYPLPSAGPSTGSTGSFSLSLTAPAGPTRRIASIQGLTADPTTSIGFSATARLDIGVQVAPSQAPALAPYASAGPAPFTATGALPCASSVVTGSATYPWPRDTILPNHGPVASAAGVNDGTLHSLLGSGFDARNQGGTTVSVNGVPADVWVVRPNEILFRLLPDHEEGIAGPVVVTSTGGTSVTEADQMENWVFATPQSTFMVAASPSSASPPYAGVISNRAGLHAGRGMLPAGGHHDWRLPDRAMGHLVRALVVQVRPCDGQFVARHATNLTGATGFALSAEPFTQMPAGPGVLVEDLILRHVHGVTSFTQVGQAQDDGGPGTTPFAGNLGIPEGATVAGDPDAPFSMMGTDDALRVEGAGASSGPGPYTYILLVSQQ